MFDRRAVPSGAVFTRWTAADGWALRRFDWPVAGAARGSILFQGGRGDIPEKYLESFAHWHAAGWNVSSLDWRGQGGSGRLTPRPHCGHIDSFEDYLRDIDAFGREWRAASPGPHVAIGHSMGGHLILRALVEARLACDAAILVVPMLGLKAPISAAFGERLARILAAFGKPDRPAWKGNEKPHTTETRQSLLTHHTARYEDELFWQASDPALMTGPPSWRWLTQAFASTRQLRTDPRLAKMRTPLLALIADADGLVDPAAALAMLARLPDARLVRFGNESAHEILREVDAVRDRALAEIDAFLAERAPAWSAG